MLEELEVLRTVSERLEAAQLTGSFAMAYYGKPRMTRDLDIVVSLNAVPIWTDGPHDWASPRRLLSSRDE